MRPEKTLAAFEYAAEAGADAIEMDVAVTQDDVPVISHDPVLASPLCRGPEEQAIIRQLTLEQVRQWDCGSWRNPLFPKQTPAPGARMPTLKEVFNRFEEGTLEFNLEIKSFPAQPQLTPSPEEFSRLVLEEIREHRLEWRVIVQSFDFRILVAMKKLAPEIRLSALWENGPRDFVSIAREAGGTPMISPRHDLVTRDHVAAAHEAGIQVMAWTANTPEEWRRLAVAGVDGIITDDPAGLIAWLGI